MISRRSVVLLFFGVFLSLIACERVEQPLGKRWLPNLYSEGDVLIGKAFLEAQEEHSGIRVSVVGTEISTSTARDGSFSLDLSTLSDERWTIGFKFPFYKSATREIWLKDAKIYGHVPSVILKQILRVRTIADKVVCGLRDTLKATLVVENVSEEDVQIEAGSEPGELGHLDFVNMINFTTFSWNNPVDGADVSVILSPGEYIKYSAKTPLNELNPGSTIPTGAYWLSGRVYTKDWLAPYYLSPVQITKLSPAVIHVIEQPKGDSTVISGQALLVGHPYHDGIRVINVQTADTAFTDAEGYYRLSMPEWDGFYTITADYLYFTPSQVQVEIENRKPKTFVPPLLLDQELKVKVTTDKVIYSMKDTMIIKVEITNISNHTLLAPVEIRGTWTVLARKENISEYYVAVPGIPNPDMGYWREEYQPGESKTFQKSCVVGRFKNYSSMPIRSGTYLSYVCWPGYFGIIQLTWHWIEPAEIQVVD